MANTIIITGANGSLAIPTIAHLLQRLPDSTLVLTVRDASDRDANTKYLRSTIAKHPKAHTSIRELDLSRLTAVHDFARSIVAEIAAGTLPRLSAIVCTVFYWNLVDPVQFTDDGYEKTMQVNYLSHVALVLQLISSFQSHGGRIVLFTGDSHEPGKNALDKVPPAISSDPAQLDQLVNPGADASNDALGHGMYRYANSKLALVLFTHALNRRLQQNTELRNITAIVMNPGNLAHSRAMLVNTPYKLVFLRKFVLRPLLPLLKMTDPTARIAAAAAIDVARLATNEAHPGERGYFTLLKPDQGSEASRDEMTQEALWLKNVLWVGLTSKDLILVRKSVA
ncbi:NAD(P)-binding protein [Mollisia scopiformis]|uniref:NAD(P)-binding protein n=1 Tax=Mollisia scopiformis TaxID=149040 RepID=A0A194XMS2_MOLSC|nr:NAD(P)-binding protein [Mollisia scopiformis]KUJ21389.1 NAD(P)-binding protein [Mollisia scopiformis]